MRRYFKLIIVLVLFFPVSGCLKKPAPALPPSYTELTTNLKTGDIVHIQTGYVVSEKNMIDIIRGSRIIYIGETHDNIEAHRVQLDVIKKLYELDPDNLSIGMEMFPKSYQKVLDKWSRGELTEKEFIKQVKWYSTWGTDFKYYADIFSFIKEKKLPLIGLNVPQEIIKDMRINGIERTKEIYKEDIPEIDTSDPYYLSFMKSYFSGHGSTGRGLETFIQIQAMWDEIMAKTVVDYLARKDGMKMVVLAGGNHVNYGFGIPRRAFRQMPLPYRIIIPKEISIPEDKKEKLMNVDLPDMKIPVADFLWMVNYTDFDNEKIRLGVMIDDTQGKIVVKSIIPASLAEKSGITAGDVISKFNNEILTENSDLIYLLDKEKPGNHAVLEIIRGEAHLKIDVTLTISSSKIH
ncbi:MAG: ChaN family lipoprotein [bacterium]|nr:ChaN family lipoprotein [bacterium]